MNPSIALITPKMQRQRGAKAFLDGVPIDGHNMNPGAPAIVDWMRGWRLEQLAQQRQTAAARTELVRQVARQQLVEVSPP